MNKLLTRTDRSFTRLKRAKRSHGTLGFVVILLQHPSLDKLVDELLHGVEGGEEALRRHDKAGMGFWNGRLAFFGRLKRHEVKADHSTRKMDLPDAVGENFVFVFCHCRFILSFKNDTQKERLVFVIY